MIKYNPSIDGLRALAVLSVFIFHLNEEWLSGGFLGVDIFFTISGFLITNIILREYKFDKFSYAEFYKRRIKRILPAYLFMLAIVSTAAFFIMLPYDFYKFSISGLSSLLFISNLNFSLRAGDYFSADATQWPLLHTWSLSVEEQFYIIWPFFLGALFLISKNHINAIKYISNSTVFLIILSISAATILSLIPSMEKWNYYLVITRSSELLIGALLAIWTSRSNNYGFNQIFTIPAFFILIICFIYYDKSLPFPGYWVLPPCVAAAIILGGRQRGYVYQILSSTPLVKIGLLSYSLYLWHWPLISFTRYIYDFGGNNSFIIEPIHAFYIFLASFTFAWLSFKYIEKPIRNQNLNFSQSFFLIFLIPTIIGSVFFIGSIISNGYPNRLKSDSIDPSLAYFSINKNRCPDLLNLGCKGGSIESQDRYLIIGNSHAEHYFELFHLLAKNIGVGVDLSAGGGCSLTIDSKKCQNIYKYAIQNSEKYVGFILAENWSSDFFNLENPTKAAYENYIESLKKTGKPILIVGRVPQYYFDMDKIFNYQRILKAPIPPELDVSPIPNTRIINNHVKLFTDSSNIKFINIYEKLLQSSYDLMLLDNAGRPRYLDNNHLSVYGSESIANHIIKVSSREEISKYYFGIGTDENNLIK